MLSKEIYICKVNHPVLNGPYAGKVVLNVRQRKWMCPNCDAYFNDTFSFLGKGKQSTDFLPRCDKAVTGSYLASIPFEERNRIEFVINDM